MIVIIDIIDDDIIFLFEGFEKVIKFFWEKMRKIIILEEILRCFNWEVVEY